MQTFTNFVTDVSNRRHQSFQSSLRLFVITLDYYESSS